MSQVGVVDPLETYKDIGSAKAAYLYVVEELQ